MSASNFNLRGVSAEIMELLKREAKRLRTSVNSLVLKMIEEGLGMTHEKMAHHDLDHLANSWSASDEKAFKESTLSFEQIDENPSRNCTTEKLF